MTEKCSQASSPVNAILERVVIPPMVRVRQHFDATALDDPASAIKQALERPELKAAIKPGMKVAITAGSRGIDNFLLMLRQTVEFVRRQGGEPFLVPAMGSHGGATADGQTALLAGYGITEETVGAPIRSTMEVVQICQLSDGTPVYIDRYAHEADGIIVVNRIKPHTNFRGRYESGLFKMMAIGLGKQYGASVIHAIDPRRMGERICQFGQAILHEENVLFGLASIENAYDRSVEIASFTPREIEELESAYLEKAKALLPRIMFADLDVLIVDQIGKNISGTGMDPNITHTFLRETGISTEQRAKRIVILDLSEKTHGAASGLGVADATTRRVLDKMDFNKTYPNSLTTKMTESIRIPMVLDNQELAIKAGICTSSCDDPSRLRMVRIQDTLHLGEIEISAALLAEAQADPNIELLGAPASLTFDSNGDLF